MNSLAPFLQVNVWNTTTWRKLCVLDLGRGSSREEQGVDIVSCCALGRSGTVVAGSYDKSLRVWRLPIQDQVVRNFSPFCPILFTLLTDLWHLLLFSISSIFGLIF